MKIKALLAISMATMIAAPAMAQDQIQPQKERNNEFLGGYSHINASEGLKYNGFNLEIRRHYNDYFAFGGAFNYGTDKSDGTNFNTNGFDANVLLKFPIQKAYLYAKGGLSYTKLGYSTPIIKHDKNGKLTRATIHDSDTKFTPAYGVGVNIPIGERWTIDASWTRKSPEIKLDNAAKTTGNLDAWVIQAGWKF